MNTPTPNTAKEGIDPSIPEKTLKLIRAIGKGNGWKDEDVKLDEISGHTFYATAQTIITLEPLITQQTIPGREASGKVLESKQHRQQEIEKSSSLISNDDITQKKIKKLILDREDKGFAMKNHKQKFHDLKKGFVLHYNCQSCSGNGKIGCQQCKATGRTTCGTCQGSRQTQCMGCRGAGSIQTNQGQSQCRQCHGQRKISCTGCRGQGQTHCRTCGGNGRTQCQPCAATGWMSDSTLVEQEGTAVFHVNPNGLPENITQMIEKTGQAMLMRNDLECDVRNISEEEKAQLKPSQTALGYQIKIPLASLTINIKGLKAHASLMGYQGRLTECAPFLEKIAGKHLSSLSKAAKAPSTQTYSLLEKACSKRIVRDIIQNSAEHGQRNALKILQKKYPYGIQEKTLKGMIKHSRKSFLDLTRSGRYKGFAIGLIAACIMTCLYYFGLRESTLSHISNTTLMITLTDTMAFIIGLILNLSLVQAIGKSDLSKNLESLLKKPIKVNMSQVRTGKAWIWSTIGNIILFLGISWVAIVYGHITTLPIWLML